MAGAIIQGLLRGGACRADEVIAACPDAALLESLRTSTGVHVTSSNAEAAASAPVVMLCVKPGDVPAALEQAGGALDGKLLVSIAAGVTLLSLKKLAPRARVIRAMPNTPAMVGAGATAFAGGEDVTPDDTDTARHIFSCVGSAYPVREEMLDAVTGLSGSGPAYVCLVVEALSDGGVAAGLPRKLALELAVQTLAGVAGMISSTGEHPAVLREMVTSPGGTTVAGLAELEAAGVRSAFLQAVLAASGRARELSRQ